MPKITSILVPVDFSDVSANALNYALHLADAYPVRVDLLHVIPPVSSEPGIGRMIAARSGVIRREAEEEMAEFRRAGVDKAMQEGVGIPEVNSLILDGDLEPLIRSRIDAGEVGLIVMGSSGNDKPLSKLVGTNTTFLIDEVSVPVLIVPDEATYRRPTRICYSTDLQHLDPFRITEVLELFEPFTPSVEFAYVVTPGHPSTEYTPELLRTSLKRPDLQDRIGFIRLEGKTVVDAILQYVKTAAPTPDLLIMNRPKRGWLNRLLIRSRTREAMLKAEIPLLILHQAEALG